MYLLPSNWCTWIRSVDTIHVNWASFFRGHFVKGLTLCFGWDPLWFRSMAAFGSIVLALLLDGSLAQPCPGVFFFGVWWCGWAIKMGNMWARWEIIGDGISKNISGSDWGINKAKIRNLLRKNLEPVWKGLNMWQFSQSIARVQAVIGTLHPKTTGRCKHLTLVWFAS